MKVCNAFSMSMLEGESSRLWVRRISAADAATWVSPDMGIVVESHVGHYDVAYLMGRDLKREIPVNRANLKLGGTGDRVLVGQYIGPRLPEGATRLPEGAKLEWYLVEVMENPSLEREIRVEEEATLAPPAVESQTSESAVESQTSECRWQDDGDGIW